MHAILRGLGVFSLSIFLVGLAHAQEAKEPIARAGQAQAGGSVEPAGVSTTDGKEPIARAGRAQAQGGGALEPSAVSTEGGREPIARGAPGSRRGRSAPSRMVLCRGPRGAVYARDESVGCRNQTLVPGNLVDFGPGRDRGCALRPRMAGSKEAQAVETCTQFCAAGERGERCVVALRPEDGGAWGLSDPDASWTDDRDAIAVCCRP